MFSHVAFSLVQYCMSSRGFLTYLSHFCRDVLFTIEMKRVTLYISLCDRYFAVPLAGGRLNYKSVTKPYVFTHHFNLSYSHLYEKQVTLFILFQDNSYIQPYLNVTKILIFSSFAMFLESII